MKKFKDYLKKRENVSADWQETLLQVMKEEHFFSGDETPIGRILDRVFTAEKPNKEDVKACMLKYLEEAIDLAFGEEWNEQTTQQKEETPEI